MNTSVQNGATLEQRLESTEATLDAVRRDYQSASSDIERLTRRESDLGSELGDVCAARDTLQRRLGDATAALESTGAALDAMRRDYQSAQSDIQRLTRRESDLVSELADVCARA